MTWKIPDYHDELERLHDLGVGPGSENRVRIGRYGNVPWRVDGYWAVFKSTPKTLHVMLKSPSGESRTVFSWEILELF